MSGFSSLRDVEAVEARGLPPDLPQSTYEMIRRGASLNPEAPALSFFLSVNDHRTPQTWSYAALLARITQMANFFDSIGVKKDSVIAFVLPNLPETHFVIWGGQAAGIVALAASGALPRAASTPARRGSMTTPAIRSRTRWRRTRTVPWTGGTSCW
mgnify:CR=1 FL=1